MKKQNELLLHAMKAIAAHEEKDIFDLACFMRETAELTLEGINVIKNNGWKDVGNHEKTN